MKAAAEKGISGSSGALPHAATIQKSFGGYDISNVQAHLDPAAHAGATAMGAQAYATGNHVAFASGGASLHTAAHEAAHVVQQKEGVSLSGGVGQAGDKYETHANQVADAVVAGKSAEGLLGEMSGGGGQGTVVQKRVVQRDEVSADPKATDLLKRVAGTGTEYSVADYQGKLVENLIFLLDAHRDAMNQAKWTLEEQTFDAADALKVILRKRLGQAVGAIPVIGATIDTIIDIGETIYKDASAASKSQSITEFFRAVLTRIGEEATSGRAKIEDEFGPAYEDMLNGLADPVERQAYMDKMRRQNQQAGREAKSATDVEKGLYEAYLTGRQKTDGFLGIGDLNGRIQMRYRMLTDPMDIRFGEGPQTTVIPDGVFVVDSGNDSAVAARLNALHESKVDVGALDCPKSRAFTSALPIRHLEAHYNAHGGLVSGQDPEVLAAAYLAEKQNGDSWPKGPLKG